MRLHKQTNAGALKLGSELGSFTATIAVFNVKDADNDVHVPGCFVVGQKVKIAAWGHNWAVPNPGRGVIGADEERAWVDGLLNLDTEIGRETYATMKFNGREQQMSYGYDVLKSHPGKLGQDNVTYLNLLRVHEASPVLLGAGGPNVALQTIKAGGWQASPEAERISAELLTMGWDAGVNGSPAAALAQIATLERVTVGAKRRGRDPLAARVALELLELDLHDTPTKQRKAAGPRIVYEEHLIPEIEAEAASMRGAHPHMSAGECWGSARMQVLMRHGVHPVGV